MKVQFLHQATTSFNLWLDHIILERGEAYSNQTGVFYNYSDERIPDGYNVFGCPQKQWVTDSSITGATIPTGVYANGSLVGRSNDTVLDFENGRVISSEIPSSATVTGSYSVKDFNIRVSNDDEEELILSHIEEETKRRVGSDKSYSYVQPYDVQLPVIFVNPQSQNNIPFALGGMDETKIRFGLTIFCQNSYQLDGILSLLADTFNKTFYEVPFSSHPVTEYGDIKGGSYNYLTAIDTNAAPYYIYDVKTSKLADSARRNLTTDFYVGFVDFDIGQIRNPRS